MESCLNLKPERVGSVVVEDLKKDLFSDFSRISASQDPVLLEKEHLHVYLRIRPFTAAESDLGESQECVTIEGQDTVVLKAPRTSLTSRQSERWGPQTAQRFQFSQVYGPETTQREMFDGTTKRLVKDVLKGENSVVFTYGVTNAGKTFTFLGPESDGGILPRSLNVIFNSIEGRVYAHNNIKPHRCIDFTRLTKDQQDEEATNKRNLLRRFKENDSQKSSASLSGKTLLEGSLSSDLDGQVGADSFCLDEDPHVKFSVWVSFCEIYNENIHDLLEVLPNSSQRRTVLRLSQDIKGNSFIKDLKWIQVNDADEAYKVMKIGRKSQSFSSTKLNYVSSRSHSIFSIRILRIEDVGVPRVQTISELSLCDLAGSERCAKTQNKGDRLKEAGNINTSLLTLGKCINALRLNQTQSKFQQHIPFRESKLTHYLQGFFCGRGKACMIVNINQCASMFDETLNVLKFSAVAQKVVVLNPKPTLILPKRSARDVSFLINNADRKEWDKRNSSLLGWEMSLEDVQEGEDDEDDEEMEEEDDESYVESMEEDTVLEAEESHHLCEEQIKELREELSREQSEKLALESRIREEVTTEFMELFSKMEGDYNERIKRETEIIEERAERRLEILKNLVNRNGSNTSCTEDSAKGSQVELLTGVIEAMQDDLVKIKRDAEAAQTCLASSGESPGTVCGLRAQLEEMAEELLRGQQLANAKTKEMEMMHVQCQQTSERLQETQKSYESQMVKCQELMAICQEKDDMISTLQTALDQNVEAATKDRALIDSIKEEILELRNNCKCLRDGEHSTGEQPESAEMQELRQELKCQDASLAELRSKLCSLEHAREEALSSLEKERTDTGRLAGENRSLARELRLLQLAVDDASSKLQTAEVELARQTDVSAEFAEKLRKAEASLGERGVEASEQKETMESMAREVEHLRKKLTKPESSPRTQRGSSSFRGTMEALQEECEKMVAASQERSRRVEELEQELGRAREEIRGLEELCRQTRSGQQEEQEVLREQLKRQQETLAAREAQIAALQENLQEAQNKLCQAQEESQRARGAVEEEEKGRREAEERLTQRGAELERKAHQLLESRELCEDGLDQIKSLSLDLQEKEREISHLKDKLTDCGAEMEQMQREIMSVNQENKSLQLKLCESEWMKNEALNGKEQTIHQLRTVQGSDAKSVEPPRQDRQRAHQDLLAKESIMEDVPLELTQTHQEERTSEQQLEVEAPPEETGALSEELCENFAERADLKDGRRDGGGGGGHPERASVAPLPGPSRATLHEQRTPASTAEAEDGLRKESAEGGDLVTALRSEMECFRNSRKKVKAKGNLHGDSSSPTLEAQQMSVLDSSVVSTESGRQLRFPKPELEIQFSPLKPDRLAIRTPGQDTSFTVKISRTARKRKSTDMEGSVESENRKNTRFRGNSRVNMFSSESPPVLGNKAHRLNLQGSSASLKNRKDGTLQKIGDFIQSSPALLGSKAKKVIGIVTAKSPGREPVARPKRSKRKLHKTQISSPLDIPSHPIIGADQDDKESDHLIIKRNLRTRPTKK